jgi:hypothetical protein
MSNSSDFQKPLILIKNYLEWRDRRESHFPDENEEESDVALAQQYCRLTGILFAEFVQAKSWVLHQHFGRDISNHQGVNALKTAVGRIA